MGIRFFKIALVYLVLGVALGIALGITQKFQFAPVHAHINLLGWATFALAGLIYVLFPQAAQTRLALWQFWLQNIGVPIFIIGLILLTSGNEKAVPVVMVGSLVTLVSVLIFMVNVFANVRDVKI